MCSLWPYDKMTQDLDMSSWTSTFVEQQLSASARWPHGCALSAELKPLRSLHPYLRYGIQCTLSPHRGISSWLSSILNIVPPCLLQFSIFENPNRASSFHSMHTIAPSLMAYSSFHRPFHKMLQTATSSRCSRYRFHERDKSSTLLRTSTRPILRTSHRHQTQPLCHDGRHLRRY